MQRDEAAIRILCTLLPNNLTDRAGGQVDANALVGVSVALADKLLAATKPPVAAPVVSAQPARTAPDLITDDLVLRCLVYLANGPASHGARRSHWLSACEQAPDIGIGTQPIGRRAFDSAKARLLAAGKVRTIGTRFLPVANSATV